VELPGSASRRQTSIDSFLPSAEIRQKNLIPLGNAVGITLKSEGVIVVGLSELTSGNGLTTPARDAGIIPGDVITQINTREISSADDIRSALSGFDGKPVSVRVRRGEKILQFTLTPSKNEDGRYELGVWLRDTMAGIGTMTFYDPETNVYGALGHAITDVDTGITMPLREGTLMHSVITDIIPGRTGSPGQLLGVFSSDRHIGTLTANSEQGIFGSLTDQELVSGKTAVPAAKESEIDLGDATILTNISGSVVAEYSVEITRIYRGAESNGRSMMLVVTDPALLEKTGGIVQGMSGSPILQDGKIIGAVTHVLINNPAKATAYPLIRCCSLPMIRERRWRHKRKAEAVWPSAFCLFVTYSSRAVNIIQFVT
jgi:stage IV sporulation protein B